MIIRGILDRSLSSQICVRGFAPIKELARISKANYSYQRKLINEQEIKISNFLETEQYLFFPEVILSFKVKHDYSKKELPLAPLQLIENGNPFTSNVDKTKIRVKKIDYKTRYDVRQRNEIILIEIELDDERLAKDISDNNHPFDRIDGNHRLSASESLNSSRVQTMNIPFCIILAELSIGREFDHEVRKLIDPKKSNNAEKFEMVVFHNINTKTIPLTSEQNLRVIIDDSVNFPDNELKLILGESGLKTRKLISKQSSEFFTGIKHIINDQFRTYYLDIFDRLDINGTDESDLVDKVFESLKQIDVLYLQNPELSVNSNIGLLTAFLYYHVNGNIAKFNNFKSWVMRNQIFEIPEAKADSFISIFDKIAEQEIMVFVAMPYFNPVEITEYNKAYQRVIKSIKVKYSHVSIDVYPIMTHSGASKNILQNMLNEIKNCSIFISDITNSNVNVAFELGYAKSLEKPTIIIKQEGDKSKVPFDFEHDSRKEYLPNALHTLEQIVEDDIIEILKRDYGLIT